MFALWKTNILKKISKICVTPFTTVIVDENSVKECENIVNQPLKNCSKENLFDILYDLVDSIQVNDNTVYINLNKNLILRSDNIVHIANNLNIQLAGNRVELQPQIRFNYKNKKQKAIK